MKSISTIFLITSLLVASATAMGDSAAVRIDIGASVRLPELSDQFDNTHQFKPQTSWLVFTHDMDSGFVVKQAFEGLDGQTLTTAGIQYYSDISEMPGFIRRVFAMPKFKTLNYPMILGRETKDLEHLPRQSGRAMLMRIKGGELTEIIATDDPEKIKQQLLLAPSL